MMIPDRVFAWPLLIVACGLSGVSGTAAIADTNTSSDEVRALVSEMLNDAQTRSSLLQGGGSAGHDGKFFMASADGNFRMNVSGQVQFRWVLNSADEAANAGYNAAAGAAVADDMQHGFENSRTKLTFDGDVGFGQHNRVFYKVSTSISRSFGTASLSDGYVGLGMGVGGQLKVGQFKSPLHREYAVSSKYTQPVDRSLTNSFFNHGRTQGIAFENSANSKFHYLLLFSDGIGQSNTRWSDTANLPFLVGDSDFSLTARGEVLLDGDWSVFKDMTSAPGQGRAVLVGFGAHYQTGDDTNSSDGDLFAYTFDVSLEDDGWNVFVAMSGQQAEIRPSVETDDLGFVLQGGYYFNDTTEGFVRYDLILLDDVRTPTAAGGNDALSTITVGVNRFLHGHAAKLTLDANIALDEGLSHFDNGLGGNLIYSSSGLGYLGDDDAGEIYVRAQLQLLF